jgi:hypothetical protein
VKQAEKKDLMKKNQRSMGCPESQLFQGHMKSNVAGRSNEMRTPLDLGTRRSLGLDKSDINGWVGLKARLKLVQDNMRRITKGNEQ